MKNFLKNIPNLILGIIAAAAILYLLKIILPFMPGADDTVDKLSNIIGLLTFIFSVITFFYAMKIFGRSKVKPMIYTPGVKSAVLVITTDASIVGQVFSFWRRPENKEIVKSLEEDFPKKERDISSDFTIVPHYFDGKGSFTVSFKDTKNADSFLGKEILLALEKNIPMESRKQEENKVDKDIKVDTRYCEDYFGAYSLNYS